MYNFKGMLLNSIENAGIGACNRRLVPYRPQKVIRIVVLAPYLDSSASPYVYQFSEQGKPSLSSITLSSNRGSVLRFCFLHKTEHVVKLSPLLEGNPSVIQQRWRWFCAKSV